MPRCTATNLNGNRCRNTAFHILAVNGVDVDVCTRHRTLTPEEYMNRADPAAAALAAEVQEAPVWARPRELGARKNQPTLRRFLEDTQNVHTSALIEGQKPILDALFQSYRGPNEIPSLEDAMLIYKEVAKHTTLSQTRAPLPQTTLSRMKELLFSCFMKSPTEELIHFVRRHIMPYERVSTYTLRIRWVNGREAMINYTQLFRVVLSRICSTYTRNEDRAILLSRLMEELKDGIGVCSHGQCARLLNVFAGFEEVVLGIPPVDPRSLSEKLGAAFAVLREKDKDPESMRKEGLEILLENGVIGAEKQAEWLDAL